MFSLSYYITVMQTLVLLPRVCLVVLLLRYNRIASYLFFQSRRVYLTFYPKLFYINTHNTLTNTFTLWDTINTLAQIKID